MFENGRYSISSLTLRNRDFEIKDFYQGLEKSGYFNIYPKERSNISTPNPLYSTGQGVKFEFGVDNDKSNGFKLCEDIELKDTEITDILSQVKFIAIYGVGTRHQNAVVHKNIFRMEEIKTLVITNDHEKIEYDFEKETCQKQFAE